MATDLVELVPMLRLDALAIEKSAHAQQRRHVHVWGSRRDVLALPPLSDLVPGRFSPVAGRLWLAADLLDPGNTPDPDQARNSVDPEPAPEESETAA